MIPHRMGYAGREQRTTTVTPHCPHARALEETT